MSGGACELGRCVVGPDVLSRFFSDTEHAKKDDADEKGASSYARATWLCDAQLNKVESGDGDEEKRGGTSLKL